jgi:hypothetical protein
VGSTCQQRFISPSRSLSLSVLVGPTCWRRSLSRAFPFPHCPASLARQPDRPFTRPFSLIGGSRLSDLSLPNRPRYSSWTRPRPRVSQPRPTRPSFFWTPPSFIRPSPLRCALSRAPSPSLSLYAHAQGVSSPLAVVSRPFCGRRRALAMFVASVSSTLSPAIRDALRFAPSPSGSPGPRSLELSSNSRRATTVDPSPRCVPATVQGSQNLSSR